VKRPVSGCAAGRAKAYNSSLGLGYWRVWDADGPSGGLRRDRGCGLRGGLCLSRRSCPEAGPGRRGECRRKRLGQSGRHRAAAGSPRAGQSRGCRARRGDHDREERRCRSLSRRSARAGNCLHSDQAAHRQSDHESQTSRRARWSRRATCCSSSTTARSRPSSHDRSQIRKDQAQIVQAKRDTDRADGLLTKGAGTVVQRDTNSTTLKSLEAQLESDDASRQSVLTQLSFTEIRAPVSGRIGSITSKAGTVVRIADTRCRACSPPSTGRSDLRVVRDPAGHPARSCARDGQGSGQGRRHHRRDQRQSGAMAFIENTVDPNTGTVTAKARIDNANEGLWPGQFVKVEVVLASSRKPSRSRQPPSSSARRAPTCSSSRTVSPKSGLWS